MGPNQYRVSLGATTLRIQIFRLMTLSIQTFMLMTLSIQTFRLMAVSIQTFRLITLSIATKNATPSIMTLSLIRVALC
jgi:hypothetical protein